MEGKEKSLHKNKLPYQNILKSKNFIYNSFRTPTVRIEINNEAIIPKTYRKKKTTNPIHP